MKLGLVRHFKVDYKSYHPFYYPDEYRTAIKGYDEADIILGNTLLNGIDWQICFCSTFKRAMQTAEHIFKKEILKTELLREVDLAPFTNRKIKLPTFIWHGGARISWAMNSKSQPETKNKTIERMKTVYSMAMQTNLDNVLIVSHGFFMKCFADYLRKNGFKGIIDQIPHNGKLYVFEKERN